MFTVYGLGTMGMGLSIATATSMITSDIVSKTVTITMYSLSSTLSYMSETSENVSIKKYHNEIELLDIEFKLNLIHNWLKSNYENDNEKIERKNESIESQSKVNEEDVESQKNLINNINQINENKLLLYNGIRDICIKMNKSIENINTKIKEHQQKWFHTYRNLSLDDEIDDIKKYNKILNERIYLSILK